MLTTSQKIRESLLLTTLNILLPSADVYTDVYFIVRLNLGRPLIYIGRDTRNISANSLYQVRHPNWAALLLGPCLINYALCWFAWYNTDKRKAFTWIAPLLSAYPQWVAARAIWLLWTQPSEGMREKKHLERNLMGNEVFTEAVPTALAMTFFLIQVQRVPRPHHSGEFELLPDPGESCDHTCVEIKSFIIGEPILFICTYTTSMLSAGLGLAKCLKVRL